MLPPETSADGFGDLDNLWAARTPFIDFMDSELDITLGGLFESAFPEPT
jgi:hypothetical protein